MIRIIFALLLSGMVTGAGAEEMAREDFAYEVPITVPQTGSVYRVSLIADIYKTAVRPDLGDMRVFNAAGETVPHGLVRPALATTATMLTLPIFPVAVGTPTANSDMSVHIERSKDGSIVRVRTSPGATADRTYYLIDASRVTDPIAGLELDWKTPDSSAFIGNLQIEESEELKFWRPIGQGALAHLARDGQLLEQKRVSFSAHRVKYLRLSWGDPNINAQITAVKGDIRPNAELQRDWTAIIGEPNGEAGTYQFVLAGQMPVDRVRILLPMNSVARVSVLSRTKDGDAWTLRGEKTVFMLADARGDLKDNEIALAPAPMARHWLLRSQMQSNGGTVAPSLEFGWIPHQLVLVAHGQAPFGLAYGHTTATPVDYGIDELVRRSKRDGDERVQILDAQFGSPYARRGSAALSVSWYRGDWKQWFLWAVLVTGVAALGFVALRLMKQLNTNPVEKG